MFILKISMPSIALIITPLFQGIYLQHGHPPPTKKQQTMAQINYYLNFLKFYLDFKSNSQNLKQIHSVMLIYSIMLNVILLALNWRQCVNRDLTIYKPGHGVHQLLFYIKAPMSCTCLAWDRECLVWLCFSS